jgi:hypothetical protein
VSLSRARIASNSEPDDLPLAVAAFEHLVGTAGRDYLGVHTMFEDQQIGGSPDVAIGDHSGPFRSAAFALSATSPS